MNIKMKYLLTMSLAAFLSACDNPNNSVPIQASDSNEYQNARITNTPTITNTEALAIGATGVATGYALAKYANKPRYSKLNKSYGKPVVVVNKLYYQSKPKVRVTRYKRK